MADMKYLNTRVRLKYDSLGDWTSKNPTLLEGELAIAYLGPTHTATTPDNGTHPVLFKVGPGKFNDLPWASALAADVYDWAKQTALFIDGTEATTTTSGDKTYVGNAYTEAEWDSTLNGGKGGLKLVKGTQFATKAELDAALEAFGGDLDAITDNNTKYTFEIPASGDHAGQLAVTEINYVNGAAEGTGTTKYYDFITPDELADILKDYYTKNEIADILKNYYTKGEVDSLIQGVEAEIPTELGVMSVTGKEAIKAEGSKDVTVSLALDNTGNVTLSQSASGLKATVEEYSIVKDSTSDYAATYHLTKGGVNVGVPINIPKDMVVESGEVKELEAGSWGNAGTYIVITLANATDDKLYINVGDLIEYVTSGSSAGDMIVINVSDDHKVTATITDGTITFAKLDAAAQKRVTDLEAKPGLDKVGTVTSITAGKGLTGGTITESGTIEHAAPGAEAESSIDLEADLVAEVSFGDSISHPEFSIDEFGHVKGIERRGYTLPSVSAESGVIDLGNNGEGSNHYTISIVEKGIGTAKLADAAVTTEKIADHAVSAHHTKACQDYTGEDAEVWVFYCGSASDLV